jgi:hypothetical protein
MLEAALDYLDKGFSVIPIRPDKRTYLRSWSEYQQERPTPSKIKRWWSRWPDAMIGIVCGPVSDLVAIDVDTEDGGKAIRPYVGKLNPQVKSPNGWHYWFHYVEGLSNQVKVLSDIDIRTQGGVIIAPPSSNGVGKYEFRHNFGMDTKYDIEHTLLKEVLISNSEYTYTSNLDNIYYKSGGDFKYLLSHKPPEFKCSLSHKEGSCPPSADESVDTNQKSVATVDKNSGLGTKGRRDNDLFRLANHLVKSGLSPRDVYQYCEFFARHCNPPFPPHEVPLKIKSALKRSEDSVIVVTNTLTDWVEDSKGIFTISDVYRDLGIIDRKEKKHTSKILSRMVEQGIIERYGSKNGVFRKADTDTCLISLDDEDEGFLDITWPLELEQFYRTMSKNVIIVAGSPDAGKTAFMLKTAYANRDYMPVRYQSSEMGGMELRSRIRLASNTDENEWKKIEFMERSQDWQDLIVPDGINIIDFLEVTDNFYAVGGMIKDIFDNLETGIAVIALQKDPNKFDGLGGMFSKQKPRLYVTLDYDYDEKISKARITKCKNWACRTSPNGMTCDFWIENGLDFRMRGFWKKPK